MNIFPATRPFAWSFQRRLGSFFPGTARRTRSPSMTGPSREIGFVLRPVRGQARNLLRWVRLVKFRASERRLMTRLLLRTPSRLHFGLLSWGSRPGREFGGVGLMVESPSLILEARPAPEWQATGPLANRVVEFAGRVAKNLLEQGFAANPISFEIKQAPAEHAGLGVGTQLGLAVARLITELVGIHDAPVDDLARLSGRGLRSGIGLHGFAQGGLIVDGGRARPDGIPPLLARLDFPRDWSILLVIPPRDPGLHGQREIQAFASLPASTDALTDRLCRLVLLGLLPAIVETDLPRFGEALEEIQRRVGEGFAPAQGGVFARPEAESILSKLKQEGLRGIGQSSWGPTLYGFSDASPEQRQAILERITRDLNLEPGTVFWTRASASGALLSGQETKLLG